MPNPAYWWECESCGSKLDFKDASNTKGITHFIWDVLLPSNWDQSHLLRKCQGCGEQLMRITYEYPRKEKEIIRVVHIVGLGPSDEKFIPMMWETYFVGNENEHAYDFKYIIGRNQYGLTKPAVFTRSQLKELFDLYQAKTGQKNFP